LLSRARSTEKYGKPTCESRSVFSFQEINRVGKVGCSAEALRNWVRQAERDQGKRPGATTSETERIKALEREVLERRQANEIFARVIYTTNAVESLNASLQKVLKQRKPFPNDEAILKLLYLALHGVASNWKRSVHNWKQALN
jgi:transposase-like protein